MCRLLGISKFWSGDLPSIGKVGVTYCILGVTHMCSCFNSLIVVSIPINFPFEMIVSLCWSWLGSPHTVHLGSLSGGSFGIFLTLSRLLYLHSTYMPCFHQSCWSLDHSLGFFCGFTQKPRLVSMALSARVKMESYCDGYVWFNFGQSELMSLRVIWLWKRMPCLYVGYLGNFWLFFVSNRLQTCALDNVAGLRNGKDKELKVKFFQNFIAFGCPFVQWQLQNHYLTIVLLVKKLCLSYTQQKWGQNGEISLHPGSTTLMWAHSAKDTSLEHHSALLNKIVQSLVGVCDDQSSLWRKIVIEYIHMYRSNYL